jgi:hypothetical protein
MIRGRLELLWDGLAHFEPVANGFVIWEAIENLTTQDNSTGSRALATTPPKGYGYITLFKPVNRTNILRTLSYNPRVQDLLDINPDYRLHTNGFLMETEENVCEITFCYTGTDIWTAIVV